MELFHHYVYETELNDVIFQDNGFTMVAISKDNLEEAGSAIGNTTRKWILNDDPYAKGFYFLNDDGEQIGSCWAMLKGGDEKLYRVRNHDSFIFRVQINEPFRGKGYARKMMNDVFLYLKDIGCTNTCLVCATKNTAANHLYHSLGMRKNGSRTFMRVSDRNFPYYTL